jgi:hypothetical protein
MTRYSPTATITTKLALSRISVGLPEPLKDGTATAAMTVISTRMPSRPVSL